MNRRLPFTTVSSQLGHVYRSFRAGTSDQSPPGQTPTTCRQPRCLLSSMAARQRWHQPPAEGRLLPRTDERRASAPAARSVRQRRWRRGLRHTARVERQATAAGATQCPSPSGNQPLVGTAGAAPASAAAPPRATVAAEDGPPGDTANCSVALASPQASDHGDAAAHDREQTESAAGDALHRLPPTNSPPGVDLIRCTPPTSPTSLDREFAQTHSRNGGANRHATSAFRNLHQLGNPLHVDERRRVPRS